MKICRFHSNRLGLVEGNDVLDVTAALDALPKFSWPLPQGDQLIANLFKVTARIKEIKHAAAKKPLGAVKLLSPVANPSKVIGAPVNYQLHIDEAKTDKTLNHNIPTNMLNIRTAGPFLKANSSLVGPSEGVALRFPDRRNDHEVELAVVIGKPGSSIPAERALEHVAGYAIGLDMTVRGTEDRSVRKSIDSYSVLGPWLVTADEIADPNQLDLSITVNNEPRQRSNTKYLILNVQQCIEFFSSYYTLLPGDIIMTGTPEGVGPVKHGDLMIAEIEKVGRMEVRVRNA
jgi:2-keto-4-pentenoate hydratase/2-oxohepta-3-ene-1,7-dioic acid hydratase in catechol pathway